MIDSNELRRLAQTVQSPAHNINERMDALRTLHDALPSGVVLEILDRLEAAEQTAQDYLRIDREKAQIAQRLEAAERERDALRALVVMRFDHDYPPQFTQGHDLHELTEPVTAEHCRWFVAEIERLRTDCDALRAKIEAMKGCLPYGAIGKILTEVMDIATANGADSRSMPDEYVEVAAWLCGVPGAQPAPSFADAYQGAMEEVAIWKKRALEAEDLNRKFVAEINGPTYMGEPAQPAQKAVAYLDLGVGGYMDIGTDLTDEQLASLPKGRHMLGIVGTGYVSAQPTPSVPEDFSREELEAVAAGLDTYEKTVNVGNVTGEGDDHLESTTAYAARFIRAMIAAAPEAKP